MYGDRANTVSIPEFFRILKDNEVSVVDTSEMKSKLIARFGLLENPSLGSYILWRKKTKDDVGTWEVVAIFAVNIFSDGAPYVKCCVDYSGDAPKADVLARARVYEQWFKKEDRETEE